MAADLFDTDLRARRRDRAFRRGPELFLHERAFIDCLERVGLVQRQFRSALLIGCPDPGWRERLAATVGRLDVLDPGRLFARAAGGEQIVEDSWVPTGADYDLCLTIGTFDTINDIPRFLQAVRGALQPDSLLLGAIAGGDSLPQLRGAMRAADQAEGAAAPHVHPRIEAAALTLLLTSAGFIMPVVDVDRARVSYASLDRLIRDLRSMSATNVLRVRPRTPMSRRALAAARASFATSGDGERTIETFEILHFAAWTPAP